MADYLQTFYQQTPQMIALQVTIFLLVVYICGRMLHGVSKTQQGVAFQHTIRRFAYDNAVKIKKIRVASLVIGVFIYSIIGVALIVQDYGLFMVPVFLLAAAVNVPIIAARVILPLLPWERYMQMRYVLCSTVGLFTSVFLFLCVDVLFLVLVLGMLS